MQPSDKDVSLVEQYHSITSEKMVKQAIISLITKLHVSDRVRVGVSIWVKVRIMDRLRLVLVSAVRLSAPNIHTIVNRNCIRIPTYLHFTSAHKAI